MRTYRSTLLFLTIILLGINLQSCDSVQQMIQGTPTFTSTATLTTTPTLTATPTLTLTPTETPSPTVTPNLTATQQYENIYSIVQENHDAGYIPSLNGNYFQLDDYSDSYAERGFFRWQTIGADIRNFILTSHIIMSTANHLSYRTACGFVFRVLPDNYADGVFIGQEGKAFYTRNNYIFYTSSFGNVTNPMEFDVVLVVFEKNIQFHVNDKLALEYEYEKFMTVYRGDIGFTVLSGSDEDYGSQCDFSNTQLWEIIR